MTELQVLEARLETKRTMKTVTKGSALGNQVDCETEIQKTGDKDWRVGKNAQRSCRVQPDRVYLVSQG